MFDNLTLQRVPAEDEALRPVVRELIADVVDRLSPEQRARSWSAHDGELSRRLGAAGLLGLTLPKKYGGSERSAFARFVVVEELLRIGAPVAAHWIADRQSAPLLLTYGSEQQCADYIPAICRGELTFCIGMSEPNSGSDLASVRTRAERNGRGWLVNGQKIWTTNGVHADYMIALLRTHGDSSHRHSGLSQFIIDLRAPGVTVRPIVDLTGDAHFSEIFFDNVQLDEAALVGKEGEGWAQVVAELAFERSGPERIYSSVILLDAWIDHLRERAQNGADRVSTASVHLVGAFSARLAALRAMSLACTAQLEQGEQPVIEASLVKDLGTQFEQDLPIAIGEDLAAHPDVSMSASLYRTLLYTTHIAPSFSLRGGTREILRGIIARGLGLR